MWHAELIEDYIGLILTESTTLSRGVVRCRRHHGRSATRKYRSDGIGACFWGSKTRNPGGGQRRKRVRRVRDEHSDQGFGALHTINDGLHRQLWLKSRRRSD